LASYENNTLDCIVEKNSDSTINIIGFKATVEANPNLASERAEAIATALKVRGLPATQIRILACDSRAAETYPKDYLDSTTAEQKEEMQRFDRIVWLDVDGRPPQCPMW
jgi:outer membrane protein OmpA-like peptidoglycan-associated protein